MYRVTMEACVEGNPLKAWKTRLPEEERRVDGDGNPLDPDDTAPDREQPDDVWERQSHDFGSDLEAAKDFVRALPVETTTHVRIESGHGVEPGTDAVITDDGWVVIFDQDADGDHLDAAGVDVAMPHRIDSKLPDVDESVPDAPALVSRQTPGGNRG